MGRLKGKVKARARKKIRLERQKQHDKYIRSLVAQIRQFEDPILEESTDAVTPEDQNLGEMVKQMKKVLCATKNGIGLAAPQIGLKKRIVVTRRQEVFYSKGNAPVKMNKVRVFINPEIVDESQEQKRWKEECLSYPGMHAITKRPSWVKVSYQDEKFHTITERFEDHDSCLMCHEIDHLNGVCLVGQEWKRKKTEEALAAAVAQAGEDVVS